jgi:glutaredoxin 3
MTKREAARAVSVVVYSTLLCPYCFFAKRLLAKRRIEYTEERLGRDSAGRERLSRLSGGGRTFPQIVIDGDRVGGFAELRRLDRSGGLEALAPGHGPSSD